MTSRPVGIPRRCAELRADPIASAAVLRAVKALPSSRLLEMTHNVGYGPDECRPRDGEEWGVPMIPWETVLAELRRRKIPGTRQSRRAERQRRAKVGS